MLRRFRNSQTIIILLLLNQDSHLTQCSSSPQESLSQTGPLSSQNTGLFDQTVSVAVSTYRCLHGLAPRYLSDYIQSVAVSNCRRLRSSSSSQLVIRCTQLFTVGDRAFPVARCRLWNSLLPDVTSASTLSVFETASKLISFFDHFLPNCFRFLVLHTVYSSGLAVLVL